ncbi:(2Fe-2S)-binding protein [Croceicoccus mobilis]|uniref:(2Fe-2S)-binding protein n=1 Tax=Croceicoccus mobilis TaxID=1703339 RepID=A0A916Z247_9SPHN|nr:(2Fe-2S)-binding protein [Croceicoccus mobilis]GGD72413.1 hypothetical protein GCM10010990_22430 [Croceicoccus mobilis]
MTGPVSITIDGEAVTAPSGASVAAAMLASGRQRFRDDTRGSSRGMFCNMGTCCECMVWISHGTGWTRLRACLVAVAPGMAVLRQEPELA